MNKFTYIGLIAVLLGFSHLSAVSEVAPAEMQRRTSHQVEESISGDKFSKTVHSGAEVSEPMKTFRNCMSMVGALAKKLRETIDLGNKMKSGAKATKDERDLKTKIAEAKMELNSMVKNAPADRKEELTNCRKLFFKTFEQLRP